jgi:PEP-CTERM motif
MKAIKNRYLIFLFFILAQNGHTQGFVNLDFENGTIVPDPSSPYYPNAVYASDAIPGWTATGFIGPNDILYNSASLGSTSVSILDMNGSPPALYGNFSIYLYGGQTAPSASISQTAVVSASAQSILFWSQDNGQPAGTLLVSLGGQNIPYFALATGPNRTTLYGGNIPAAFAGQSEQLTFSALEGINNAWEIDDIQFSPSSVPEPSIFGLFALGGLFFGLCRWRHFE